jgi:hypothetical protein
MSLFESWPAAFALTAVVEAPIYARALRPRPWGRALLLGALLSLPTHPLIFVWLPRIWPGSYVGYVAAAEAIAVLVEAAVLWRLGVSPALPWAVAANLASTAVGLALRAVG